MQCLNCFAILTTFQRPGSLWNLLWVEGPGPTARAVPVSRAVGSASPESGRAAGSRAGCLVTAATFQKCTLLQPASQTNVFERKSCSFRIVSILFFLEKRGKKRAFQLQLCFSSLLSLPASGTTKGSSVTCPGAKPFNPPLLRFSRYNF